MSILNQYGQPAERFARAVTTDPLRGITFQRIDKDIKKLIPAGDRRALAALSRQVVFNTSAAKETIRQKAHFACGEAFQPTYLGPDSEAGEDATAWANDQWIPQMDMGGKLRKWTRFWMVVSKTLDRDGEAFILQVADGDRPRVLMVPGYQVRSSGETVKGGQWDGARLCDGVILGTAGEPLAYRVYAGEGDREEFEDIPASSMVHLFSQDYPEQARGYPAFAHALRDILQGMESKELEVLRQLVVSNIFLIKKGITPRADDAGYEPVTNTASNETVLKEQIGPGIQYLKSDQEIEAVTHNTPGSLWESFQDRLERGAVIGAGWSYTLVGKSSGQGTAERAEVVRARLAVRERHALLPEGAVRVLTWGLTDAGAPELETLLWEFSRPARLTVDDGREDRSLLEGVKAGAVSEQEYQAGRGRTLRQHYRERAQAMALRDEIAAEFGISAGELAIRPMHHPPPPLKKMTEIEIYGEIGWEVTAADVRAQVKEADAGPLMAVIHSPGGSVIEGEAIISNLRGHPGGYHARIDGGALSMAANIAIQAETLQIPADGWLMFHPAHITTAGADASELANIIPRLNAIDSALVARLGERTGLAGPEIEAKLNGDWWINGTDAVAMGLAHTLTAGLALAAHWEVDEARTAPPAALKLLDSKAVRNKKGGDEPTLAIYHW